MDRYSTTVVLSYNLLLCDIRYQASSPRHYKNPEFPFDLYSLKQNPKNKKEVQLLWNPGIPGSDLWVRMSVTDSVQDVFET